MLIIFLLSMKNFRQYIVLHILSYILHILHILQYIVDISVKIYIVLQMLIHNLQFIHTHSLYLTQYMIIR